jgi:hypothetical protein
MIPFGISSVEVGDDSNPKNILLDCKEQEDEDFRGEGRGGEE